MAVPVLSRQMSQMIRNLHSRKGRKESGLFLVEGEKSVKELAGSGFKIEMLVGLEEYSIYEDVPYYRAGKVEMERLSTFSTAPGLIAVVQMKPAPQLDELAGNLFLLDRINDPGNLGTIIRTADWFGFGGIICSPESVDVFNPKTIQASMGSFTRIPVLYADPLMACTQMKQKGYEVLVATLGGTNIYQYSFSDLSMVILGSESHGVNAQLENAGTRITIPGARSAESLNVGIAAGVIASEVYRSYL